MGKERKNLAIEQAMDELNEELQSSVHSSPDFLISDIADVGRAPEEADQNTVVNESPVYFGGDRFSKNSEKKQKKEDDAGNADEEISDIPPIKPFVLKKKTKKKEAFNKGKKFSSDQEKKWKRGKKPEAQVNKAVSKPDEEMETREVNMVQGVSKAQEIKASRQSNIPMRITLQQSENLRVAQERIVALEREIERLRTENEDLIATGDIFRERLDKVIVQNDNLKRAYEESRQEFQEEKRTLMDTLSSQAREIEKITVKNKELEKRLSSNIQHIRVRERELENRLELMKLDNHTLAREKDQYILDLKRQIDRMKMDTESRKMKYDEISRKMEDYRSQGRRVTRGLQMILNIARGSDISQESQEIKEEK